MFVWKTRNRPMMSGVRDTSAVRRSLHGRSSDNGRVSNSIQLALHNSLLRFLSPSPPPPSCVYTHARRDRARRGSTSGRRGGSPVCNGGTSPRTSGADATDVLGQCSRPRPAVVRHYYTHLKPLASAYHYDLSFRTPVTANSCRTGKRKKTVTATTV